MTQEQALAFARNIYRGTNYHRKIKLVAWNDLYVLVQKPPTTEYVDRMTGSVYSESEWLLIGIDADLREISTFPFNVAAFSKIGKLTREDKKLLEEKFNIVIEKKERNKRLSKERFVIVYDSTYQFANRFLDGSVKLYQLLMESESSITVKSKNGERKLSKQKYDIKYFDNERDAVVEFFKIEKLIVEYNQLGEEISKKRQSINNHLKP